MWGSVSNYCGGFKQRERRKQQRESESARETHRDAKSVEGGQLPLVHKDLLNRYVYNKRGLWPDPFGCRLALTHL